MLVMENKHGKSPHADVPVNKARRSFFLFTNPFNFPGASAAGVFCEKYRLDAERRITCLNPRRVL